MVPLALTSMTTRSSTPCTQRLVRYLGSNGRSYSMNMSKKILQIPITQEYLTEGKGSLRFRKPHLSATLSCMEKLQDRRVDSHYFYSLFQVLLGNYFTNFEETIDYKRMEHCKWIHAPHFSCLKYFAIYISGRRRRIFIVDFIFKYQQQLGRNEGENKRVIQC